MEKLKSNMINDILIFIFFLLAPVSCNTPAVKKEEKTNDSFGLTFPERKKITKKHFNGNRHHFHSQFYSSLVIKIK